jgi:hypothetical protein
MQAQAVSEAVKKKYPNVLITEDYGILTEDDLASCPWDKKQKPVPISDEEGRNTNYWQCFPRNQISLTLKDTGDYEDYFGYRDTTIAHLKIEVRTPSGVHQYDMGRGSDLSSYHQLFNRFEKLMKRERHVCLLGDFGKIREQFAPNGEKIKTYGWILKNLKTKKDYGI